MLLLYPYLLIIFLIDSLYLSLGVVAKFIFAFAQISNDKNIPIILAKKIKVFFIYYNNKRLYIYIEFFIFEVQKKKMIPCYYMYEDGKLKALCMVHDPSQALLQTSNDTLSEDNTDIYLNPNSFKGNTQQMPNNYIKMDNQNDDSPSKDDINELLNKMNEEPGNQDSYDTLIPTIEVKDIIVSDEVKKTMMNIKDTVDSSDEVKKTMMNVKDTVDSSEMDIKNMKNVKDKDTVESSEMNIKNLRENIYIFSTQVSMDYIKTEVGDGLSKYFNVNYLKDDDIAIKMIIENINEAKKNKIILIVPDNNPTNSFSIKLFFVLSINHKLNENIQILTVKILKEHEDKDWDKLKEWCLYKQINFETQENKTFVVEKFNSESEQKKEMILLLLEALGGEIICKKRKYVLGIQGITKQHSKKKSKIIINNKTITNVLKGLKRII